MSRLHCLLLVLLVAASANPITLEDLVKDNVRIGGRRIQDINDPDVIKGLLERINVETGGYNPIHNMSDPYMKKMGEWAVSEYNKQSQKKLVFQSVVRGEEQVVEGVNYKLIIVVKDESNSFISLPHSPTVTYEGLVYERVWNKIRKLKSFHEVKNCN